MSRLCLSLVVLTLLALLSVPGCSGQSFSSNGTIFTVTVGLRDASNPLFGCVGCSNITFFINGRSAPQLYLYRGYTYLFMLSNTGSIYPFFITTNSLGGNGSFGAVKYGQPLEVAVGINRTLDAYVADPTGNGNVTLWYESQQQLQMGNRITIVNAPSATTSSSSSSTGASANNTISSSSTGVLLPNSSSTGVIIGSSGITIIPPITSSSSSVRSASSSSSGSSGSNSGVSSSSGVGSSGVIPPIFNVSSSSSTYIPPASSSSGSIFDSSSSSGINFDSSSSSSDAGVGGTGGTGANAAHATTMTIGASMLLLSLLAVVITQLAL